MKSFLQFLLEVKRDVPRATKLLDYIQKRWGNERGEIRTGKGFEQRHYNNLVHAIYNSGFSDPAKREAAEKRKVLKPNDIKPSQKWVNADHIRQQLATPNKKAIKAYRFDKQNFVSDGHHRLMAHRLRGMDKINTDQANLPLSKFQARRKKLTGSIDKND
jgi:hypothetical protein